jgi:Zn-dependent protease with chaperone function
VALLVLIIVAAACAPTSKRPEVSKAASEAEADKQRELIIEDRMEKYQRLANIAYPFLERNIDLCKDKTKISLEGIWVNRYSFGKEYEGTMTRMGFANTANLFATGNGSALTLAGVSVGDALIGINGWAIPAGKDAIKHAGEKLDELTSHSTTIRLDVQTKNGPRQIDVTAHRICAYGFAVETKDEVNAHADGENIVITTGLMRFTQNDYELATVFGHEMAHNVMGHMGKKETNAAIGGVFDVLFALFGGNTQGAFGQMGAEAYSKSFEAEADYVGLYLMARAGYPVDGAANIWRRFALTNPGSASATLAVSHPPTPERFLALEQTAVEIDGKIKAGAPLNPEIEK